MKRRFTRMIIHELLMRSPYVTTIERAFGHWQQPITQGHRNRIQRPNRAIGKHHRLNQYDFLKQIRPTMRCDQCHHTAQRMPHTYEFLRRGRVCAVRSTLPIQRIQARDQIIRRTGPTEAARRLMRMHTRPTGTMMRRINGMLLRQRLDHLPINTRNKTIALRKMNRQNRAIRMLPNRHGCRVLMHRE